MDDAVLDFRLGIDRLDRRRKTGQIIRTGNENILDVLADAGLIFPQHLGFEFALAISRYRYLYIAKTGAQGFAVCPFRLLSVSLFLLPTFASCSSSRIFSRRVFSSGVLFLLAIVITSVILLLFYTLLEVYTKFGMESRSEPLPVN